MTSRRLLAALCALPLLLPAAALAQSAGDEQYTDPLAGSAPAGHSPSSSSPTHNTGSPSGQSNQLASSSAPNGTGSGDPSTSSSASGSSLPRTGFDAWLLALMGAFMLIAGVLLRLGLRPLPWRTAAGSPATLGRDVRLIQHRRRY